MHRFKHASWIVCLMTWLVTPIHSYAKPQLEKNKLFVVRELKHDTSLPLEWMYSPSKEIKVSIRPPLHHLSFSRTKELEVQQDTALQLMPGAMSLIIPIINFTGIGVGLNDFRPGTTPPDTTGAPGLTQYVQIVNTSLAIFNKMDGALEFGPVDTNTLWAGFGGVCETTNQGDALVKYDQLANRWVISQFAFNTVNGEVAPPFTQCVAVSTTPNARSAYHRYAFEFDNFNDYGKIGLSPKGYFMSFFMFNNGNFLGPMACALPRHRMLVGLPAAMQCFSPMQDSGQIDLLPADLDGHRLPPSHTPEFYLSFNKQQQMLNVWKFVVNWNHPESSEFKGPFKIVHVAPFTTPCGEQGEREREPENQTQGCVPQPDTSQRLDALDDRLMYRLAYRQFHNHGTLVVNHTVGSPIAETAVRWYQLNILDNGHNRPRLVQQGTFSPNSNSRWMGSIAIDKNHNIAMGYSVSSSSTFPSIFVTGHKHGDPLGMMRNELEVAIGNGSQTGTFRWGDYSTMAIDPVDDCTFWYTTEYLQSTADESSWSTNITAFRFPNCAV